jgi:hypothetical protein
VACLAEMSGVNSIFKQLNRCGTCNFFEKERLFEMTNVAYIDNLISEIKTGSSSQHVLNEKVALIASIGLRKIGDGTEVRIGPFLSSVDAAIDLVVAAGWQMRLVRTPSRVGDRFRWSCYIKAPDSDDIEYPHQFHGDVDLEPAKAIVTAFLRVLALHKSTIEPAH